MAVYRKTKERENKRKKVTKSVRVDGNVKKRTVEYKKGKKAGTTKTVKRGTYSKSDKETPGRKIVRKTIENPATRTKKRVEITKDPGKKKVKRKTTYSGTSKYKTTTRRGGKLVSKKVIRKR